MVSLLGYLSVLMWLCAIGPEGNSVSAWLAFAAMCLVLWLVGHPAKPPHWSDKFRR